MNKIVNNLNSPYTLSLGNVDTSQYATNYVNLKCSGTGLVVNVISQESIPGNPDIAITANPVGAVTVNLSGTAYVAGSGVSQFTVAAGTNAVLKPLGDGLWALTT